MRKLLDERKAQEEEREREKRAAAAARKADFVMKNVQNVSRSHGVCWTF